MALIECPECQRQVSDKAAACPQCGLPISLSSGEENGNVVTTQQTSKGLKEQIILSYLTMGGGVFVMFCTPLWMRAKGYHFEGGDLLYGFLVLLAGLIWMLVTKFRIWWNHH